jgi:hypothetical protein
MPMADVGEGSLERFGERRIGRRRIGGRRAVAPGFVQRVEPFGGNGCRADDAVARHPARIEGQRVDQPDATVVEPPGGEKTQVADGRPGRGAGQDLPPGAPYRVHLHEIACNQSDPERHHHDQRGVKEGERDQIRNRRQAGLERAVEAAGIEPFDSVGRHRQSHGGQNEGSERDPNAPSARTFGWQELGHSVTIYVQALPDQRVTAAHVSMSVSWILRVAPQPCFCLW